MSSIARKIAKNSAKRQAKIDAKAYGKSIRNPNLDYQLSGLTQSFGSRDEVRAAMYGSQHNPYNMAGDVSHRAADMLSDAMTRVRANHGEQPDGSYIDDSGVLYSKEYRDNLDVNKPNLEGKGEPGLLCNRTACQAPGAYWLHHGNGKHYCFTCSEILSKDKFNKADADRMFGHPLVTLDPSLLTR